MSEAQESGKIITEQLASLNDPATQAPMKGNCGTERGSEFQVCGVEAFPKQEQRC